MKMSGAHADDGFSKVEGFEGEVFAQPNKTDKAIFFVHGGGFAIASPQYYRPCKKTKFVLYMYFEKEFLKFRFFFFSNK